MTKAGIVVCGYLSWSSVGRSGHRRGFCLLPICAGVIPQEELATEHGLRPTSRSTTGSGHIALNDLRRAQYAGSICATVRKAAETVARSQQCSSDPCNGPRRV